MLNFEPRENFLPKNIPHGSEGFYNTKEFSEHLLKTLGSQIAWMDKTLRQALRKMRDQFEGRSL